MAAAAATEHLGNPASQSTYCSGQVAAQPPINDVFFKDNFLDPLDDQQLLLPFPPAPTFALSARSGDAQARVPTVWPGRPRPGCVCGAANQQQRQPSRGEWRGILGAPDRCPRCSGGKGAGRDGRAGVRTGSWGLEDL